MPQTLAGADVPLNPMVTDALGQTRHGHVLGVNGAIGVAYLAEDITGRSFKVSARFVPGAIFERLREGVAVQFRDNGHNAVASIEIIQ